MLSFFPLFYSFFFLLAFFTVYVDGQMLRRWASSSSSSSECETDEEEGNSCTQITKFKLYLPVHQSTEVLCDLRWTPQSMVDTWWCEGIKNVWSKITTIILYLATFNPLMWIDNKSFYFSVQEQRKIILSLFMNTFRGLLNQLMNKSTLLTNANEC